MSAADEIRTAVAALLEQHSIAYSAVFVPQSTSRNSGEKEHTLNWRVSFTRPKPGTAQSLALDYSQGIGHVPGYKQPRTVWDQEQLGQPWETGKYGGRGTASFGAKKLPAPHVADILYSIVADDPHEQSFEDWASDFGYDTGSRKAEQIYRACIEQTRNAERVFGRALLAEIAKLLEDY